MRSHAKPVGGKRAVEFFLRPVGGKRGHQQDMPVPGAERVEILRAGLLADVLEELEDLHGHPVGFADTGVVPAVRGGGQDLAVLDQCDGPVLGVEYLDRLPRLGRERHGAFAKESEGHQHSFSCVVGAKMTGDLDLFWAIR
ncbi:hypothetical protein [Roseovarius sp. C03]|uniref:hypothetical protein n=1 Tax=Roseovarius sp. C03 TaxID=3449222 RepID=UPI003EDBF55F